MYDLVIQNARICDGTGKPSFIGTLGVTDGQITYLGRETGLSAQRTMDADGLVLAPGFIDPHTHYDAQIAWDPLLTSSPWHGVTTVVMGNCGVGVAPVKPETRDILMHDLVNVEAIPYDVMQAGIDWRWESYGEYLDTIDRRGLGINVAGLVAFTPLRHYVMGEASFERPLQPGADFVVALEPQRPGLYRAQFQLPLLGVWDAHVLVRRGDDRYVLQQRLMLR